MSFAIDIEVRFGDCDPAGIVYYPTLYHYCHMAFESLWAECIGISYPELVLDRRIGFPTVHVETDFASPIRYGDVVTIRVSVSRVGTSSVEFEFEGMVGSQRAFVSRHTKVCANLETLEPVPISDELRNGLENRV